MGQYLGRRSLHSLVSLLGLIVLVFFLAADRGSDQPVSAARRLARGARAEVSKKHGFDDPLLEQFGQFVGDLARNLLS